ncbi:MAG: response regulator [Nitrococcus mobilis]|nr:response regulator [Nitrococcus mobilis]
MRLLLVEDEWRLTETISEGLSRAGFVIDALDTVREAEQALSAVPYDALVLDLGLPDGDGLNLLAGLRQKQSELPVLILTARDAVEDRVAGLDGGADDYLVKPFAMTELLARIKALLRRPGAALGTILTAGSLTFDSIAREAAVAGRRLDLSRQELALLAVCRTFLR